jgi:hypothetical protein
MYEFLRRNPLGFEDGYLYCYSIDCRAIVLFAFLIRRAARSVIDFGRGGGCLWKATFCLEGI